MKQPKRPRGPAATPTVWTPEAVGLAPERYDALVRQVFDRAVPASGGAWYDDTDASFPEATPLEWTRFQTVLFSQAGTHLDECGDEQVGQGLRFLMDNGCSDVPYAAIAATVPLAEAMRMMQAMPGLWRDCFGPRLGDRRGPIGAGQGRLHATCYMWFDVWPTFRLARDRVGWPDAMWSVLTAVLAMPWRDVQVSALHGIGHAIDDLDRAAAFETTIAAFLARVPADDVELRAYAQAAQRGQVQ